MVAAGEIGGRGEPRLGAGHVRVDEHDQVYLASGFSSTDATTRLSNWIDTTYQSLPTQEIVYVVMENENGTLEFFKEGEDWTMAGLKEGETASSTAIFTRAVLARAALAVLGFPGLFRGALDARARRFTDAMLLAAAEAIADTADESDLVPDALDPAVHEAVAEAVKAAAAD